MAKRDDLTRYREKRDFTKTSEPKGIVAPKKGFSYLIQKHAATRLHYDFRLELDGVLKSWAVTRGPSLDPADKRLAVEVEDHPVAYGSFEGTIPKGQYGGGTVMLWDVGHWEPIGDPRAGLKKGKLEFIVHGKRLQGEWTLVRMHGREDDRGRNNWLLIKHADKFAKSGNKDALLLKNDIGVLSKRNMEKIAQDADNVWQSNSNKTSTKTSTKNTIKLSKKPAAKVSRLPGFIPPELATLSDAMPGGEKWVHEIKFDGYRTLAYIQEGKARMFTRTGLDWTPKFQAIADALATLPVENAIIDGEVVALDDKGVSNFKMLQEALSEGKGHLQYYAFDLLYLNGENLVKQPLLQRKGQLQAVLKKSKTRVFYSEHFLEDKKLLGKVCAMHMEGLISKRVDASYTSGRAKSWLKTKCHKRQEFVIGGFTEPTHKERGIGALLLGYYKEGDFIYAGKVGTGFNQETSYALRKKLNPHLLKKSAFKTVSADGRRGALWVEPTYVCEVEFTEWTPDGHLRHPSFQGLREDKPPKTIIREKAMHMQKTVTEKSPALAPKLASKPNKKGREVGGITISHPERILYPGTEISKLQLAEYYHSVADFILPHVIGRPLSMVRCPEGAGEPCFFQRHIAQGQSAHVYDTGVAVKDRHEDYMMIKDVKGLISLIQWGVIELHPWGCKADKPELADRIIFDLDPDPGITFSQVIDGVKEVRARMQELGLKSFIKTTGGKGIHVVVPIARKYGWPTIKAFARAIAESMAMDNPKRYISVSSKEKRKGKIFVDYLRNDLTSTAVSAYSARAREGATVAMPIAWDELTTSLDPKKFTIETALARLKKQADPWEEFLKIRQQIAANHLKALAIKAS